MSTQQRQSKMLPSDMWWASNSPKTSYRTDPQCLSGVESGCPSPVCFKRKKREMHKETANYSVPTAAVFFKLSLLLSISGINSPSCSAHGHPRVVGFGTHTWNTAAAATDTHTSWGDTVFEGVSERQGGQYDRTGGGAGEFLFENMGSERMVDPGSALKGRAEKMRVSARHHVLGNPLEGPWPATLRVLVMASGCFWGARCERPSSACHCVTTHPTDMREATHGLAFGVGLQH